MDGVVTILPEPYNQVVRDLWARIQVHCRASEAAPRFVNDADLPHFSWHVAESYDQPRLCEMLETVCQETTPFVVRTSGLGIFTKPLPVVYIAIVKDRPLLELHEKLWQRLNGLGYGYRDYYGPELWVPHITLAHENVDLVAIGCIFNELALQPFDWEMRVSNLAVASQAGNEHMQTCFQFSFKKE